ncbi:MAG: hypothetical protein ACNI3C_12425 [Candidatus Marinarcus sp.]|uniref:hypothetical protein n=1 Tax=Candidatus Marinarcus sp. TaxID=3100987 RepID=UPI003B00EDBC
MREINIKDLNVKIEISSLLNFINSKKEFEIDSNGHVYLAHEAPKTLPLIFRGQAKDAKSLEIQTIIANVFTKEYKPEVSATVCTLTPLGAWQNIIALNQDRMTYFDHQTDGVELFENKELENIGWNAIPLDINYREISEFIENNCEGNFMFYDNGMHFNGFVIVSDIEKTKRKVKEYIVGQIKEKIENNELSLNEIDEEIAESLEFFGFKG